VEGVTVAFWSDQSDVHSGESLLPRPPRRSQRGASLVEFAIVFAFVLVPLLFGLWEFGRIFDAWLVTTNAAREGARYAVASPLQAEAFQAHVRGRVLDYVRSGYGTRLGLGDVTIQEGDIVIEEFGEDVRVIVRANVDIWAPAVAPLLGRDTFTVTSWSTMRR
jgi:hypothetical protein